MKTNTKEFAVSWQVRKNKMSSCDDEAASATHYLPRCNGENLMHARKQCFVLKDTKFDRCHGVVNPRPHYKSCLNDMCHCPRSQVHSCLCQSLTAYARACQQKGILVKWRSKSVCGKHVALYLNKWTIASFCVRNDQSRVNRNVRDRSSQI